MVIENGTGNMSKQQYMTVTEFKTLKDRDWENGAVRDELYESVKRMEALEDLMDAVAKLPQRWLIISGQCRPIHVTTCAYELKAVLKQDKP